MGNGIDWMDGSNVRSRVEGLGWVGLARYLGSASLPGEG